MHQQVGGWQAILSSSFVEKRRCSRSSIIASREAFAFMKGIPYMTIAFATFLDSDT